MWLDKVRYKWKDEEHYGKRYSLLRKAKHRLTKEHSLTQVAKRLGYMTSTLQKFEAGTMEVLPTTSVLIAVVSDLGIDLNVFLDRGEVTEVTSEESSKNSIQKKANIKPATSSQSKNQTIVINHTEMSFILKIKGNTIEIFDDVESSKKRGGHWIAPADRRFGHELISRKTFIK